MSSDYVVEARDLRMDYRTYSWRGKTTTMALDGLDLTLAEGEVLGLLGRNGAGKTTTLRILMGVLASTGGKALIFGRPSLDLPTALKQRIGYLPESGLAVMQFRIGELLRFTSSFYPSWDVDYQDRLLEQLELDPDRKLTTLSAGQQQRVGLMQALCARPDLLILDDPLAGLDPIVRREFIDILVEQLSGGTQSVLFSSHILPDVERVATHIGIVDEGRMQYQGALHKLQESVRLVSIETRTREEEPNADGCLRRERRGERSWSLTVRDFGEHVTATLAREHPGALIEVHDLSLEEIFVQYVSRSVTRSDDA